MRCFSKRFSICPNSSSLPMVDPRMSELFQEDEGHHQLGNGSPGRAEGDDPSPGLCQADQLGKDVSADAVDTEVRSAPGRLLQLLDPVFAVVIDAPGGAQLHGPSDFFIAAGCDENPGSQGGRDEEQEGGHTAADARMTTTSPSRRRPRVTRALYAVRPARGIAAASSQVRYAGLGKTFSAGTTIISA